MTAFENSYNELISQIHFGDFTIVTKRIIDFALDTQNISHYKTVNELLNWLDQARDDAAIKDRLTAELKNLYETLILKEVAPRKTIITAENLTKMYGNHGFSLGPITLDVQNGEIIGLVGENGNGKTTLLRILCGEIHPTNGTLSYGFESADLYDLRTKLAYIPQRTTTWSGSMFENLQFTAATYGYSAQENELVTELVVARLGLRKFRNHGWKHLSSGYKMRFELARMLLRKPEVLLIDEPLANLDILAQQTILEDFRAIAKSPFRPVAVIMSSQQLYEVEKTSDQVLFLKAGTQKNLYEKTITNESDSANPLVIEFESSFTQTQLAAIFESHGMQNLQFNGGTYIVTFSENISSNDFMKIAVEENLPLTYFRNISNSSRRFFT